ncbi:unnamed protein product [Lathyrus sativus]|nr:unnamed protein product [Lathyrus sativus]
MSRVGRDGNNHIFPIAYVVVKTETKDSCERFLFLLLEDLCEVNHKSYAFTSNQHKGLVNAVQGISTCVEQRLCVKHLYSNWKKKYSGLELKEFMWVAVMEITIPAWEKAIQRRKKGFK